MNSVSKPKETGTKKGNEGPPSTKVDPRFEELKAEFQAIQDFIDENPDEIETARERLTTFQQTVKMIPSFQRAISITMQNLTQLEKDRYQRRRESLSSGAPADNLVLNGGFEEGDEDTPKFWSLEGTNGAWESENAAGGRRCLSVSSAFSPRGTVPNRRGTVWAGFVSPIDSHEAYKVTVKARTEHWQPGVKACVSIGHCVREFDPAATWKQEEFIFLAPNLVEGVAGSGGVDADLRKAEVCLGVTRGSTKLFFDDLRIVKVKILDNEKSGIRLGAGENIEYNGYTFDMKMDSKSMNYSRGLQNFNAAFSQDGWELDVDREVLYKHQVDGFEQTKEEGPIMLIVRTDQHAKEGATLKVEISKDQDEWQTLITLDATGFKDEFLPSELFPAEAIYVKLSATGRCVVTKYSYKAALKHKEKPNLRVRRFPGKTEFIE